MLSVALAGKSGGYHSEGRHARLADTSGGQVGSAREKGLVRPGTIQMTWPCIVQQLPI